MVWIIPYKRPSISGSTRFSTYKDIEECGDFILQERKKSGLFVKSKRPPFRILVSVGDNRDEQYEVAYGKTKQSIKSTEWKYIINTFMAIYKDKQGLDEHIRTKWLVAHFTTLSLQKYDENDLVNLDHHHGVTSASEDEYTGISRKNSGITFIKKSKLVSEKPDNDEDEDQANAMDGDSGEESDQVEQVGIIPRPYTGSLSLGISGRNWYIFVSMIANIWMLVLRELSAFALFLHIITVNLMLYSVIMKGDPVELNLLVDPGVAARALRLTKRTRRTDGKPVSFYPPGQMRFAIPAASVNPAAIAFRATLKARPETIPRFSWTDAEASSLNVRHGPNFQQNLVKKPSGVSLFHLTGIDLFSGSKITQIYQKIILPQGTINATSTQSRSPANRSNSVQITTNRRGNDRPVAKSMDLSHVTFASSVDAENTVPDLFVINFQIPNPSSTGEGYSLVFYFTVTAKTLKDLNDPKCTDPAIAMLKRFSHAAMNGLACKDRLKIIPRVMNSPSLTIPASMKKKLSSWNGQPFYSGPAYQSFGNDKSCLECDIDLHKFSDLDTSTAYGFINCLKESVMDLFFVVEGETDDELPEKVLGCARLNNIDLSAAKPVSSYYASK